MIPTRAICVVMTSAGYPASYDVGEVIHGLDDVDSAGAMVFHAGTARNGQHIVTAGGRVLGITGRGWSLAEAQAAGAVTLNYGAFINTLLDFLIVAFCLFMVIKVMNHARQKFTKSDAPK